MSNRIIYITDQQSAFALLNGSTEQELEWFVTTVSKLEHALAQITLDIFVLELSSPTLENVHSELRVSETTKHIPRLVITDPGASDDYLPRLVNTELDDYITKPFTFARLGMVIANLIDRTR